MGGARVGRRQFIGAAAMAPIALSGAGSAWAHGGKIARPNIVYILADDLGYADLKTFGGHGANTPHLDAMACEALRLPQAYANSSVCSPSRVALITGKYPGRMRVGLEEPIALPNPEVGLDPKLATLPHMLRNAGYATSLVGKWHMGFPPHYGPLKSGYDRFYGFLEGGGDYFRNDATTLGLQLGQMYEDMEPVERIGYLTDQLGDRSIAELQHFAKGDAPFMLSLHFNAPHWPWEGPEDQAISKDMSNLMHPTGGSVEVYAEMVRSLDANIGRVLAELRRLGLHDNTIVIFASDNGGERFSDTWPLIGLKGELLEGGIRIPLLMRWPGRFPAGGVSQQVISLFDLYPTLLHAAGVSLAPGYEIDGMDLLGVLLGRAQPVQRKLYWRHKTKDQAAVREGDWKYLRINGHEHLYNLGKDQRERAERKDIETDIFNRLKQDWADWNAQMLPYPEDSYSTSIPGLADRY